MSETLQVAVKATLENKTAQAQKLHKSETLQSMDQPVEKILFLQRTIGNQAIGRFIKSGALQTKKVSGQTVGIPVQRRSLVVQQSKEDRLIQAQGFTSTISFRQRLFSRHFKLPPGHLLKATIDSHRTPEKCQMPDQFNVYLYNVLENKYETTVSFGIDNRLEYTWKGLNEGTYQLIQVAN